MRVSTFDDRAAWPVGCTPTEALRVTAARLPSWDVLGGTPSSGNSEFMVQGCAELAGIRSRHTDSGALLTVFAVGMIVGAPLMTVLRCIAKRATDRRTSRRTEHGEVPELPTNACSRDRTVRRSAWPAGQMQRSYVIRVHRRHSEANTVSSSPAVGMATPNPPANSGSILRP